MSNNIYHAWEFNLSGLNGISDGTLETRFKLFEGYVKGTNDLNKEALPIGAGLEMQRIERGNELTHQ
jgi:hypothetical protein